MSYNISTMTALATLQSRLNDVFANMPAAEDVYQLPFLSFLNSPMNTNMLRQEVSPGQGKKRKVKVFYEPEIADADVDSDVANPVCTNDNTYGSSEEEYEIDPGENRRSGFQISAADLRDHDEENSSFLARRILKHINAVDRAVAIKSASEVNALTGKFAGDVQGITSDQLVVRTLRAGTGVTDEPYPHTMEEIMTALKQSGFGPAYIVGGLALSRYYNRLLTSGGLQASGVDFVEAISNFGYAVEYDRILADAIESGSGNNDVSLALAPGAAQILTFTQAPWKAGMPSEVLQGSNYAQMVVVSPKTGLPYDVTIKDDCGTLHVNVVGTTKVVAAPSDMFVSGGNYDGVRFINEIKVTN